MEKIRKINRALTELLAGILAFGIVCQAAGIFIVKDKWQYSAGLWIGILLAAGAAVHMWRGLDRALDMGEGAASKMMITGNLIRYGVIVIAIVAMTLTGIGNPLAGFLGVMGLKVAAYMQPFTHKLSNRIFHETDPVAEPMPEEEEKDVEKEKDE